MPTNAFSLGKDVSLVVIGPFGRVDLSIVEGFDAKQETHKVRVRPLNSPPIEAHLPNGWNGTISLERASPAADDLFAQIEAGYWAGGVQQPGTVYQYVTERDGSTSTYQFDGVVMSLRDAGSWKADSSVKQSIEFFASTRRKVA